MNGPNLNYRLNNNRSRKIQQRNPFNANQRMTAMTWISVDSLLNVFKFQTKNDFKVNLSPMK